MYEQFYNLSCRPFDASPDDKFLWLGDKHKEALAALRYGILENKGFLLLTGEQGTGKTTIINALARNLGDDVEWAIISDPALDRIDFYNAIAAGFSLDKDFSSKVQFLIQFSHFLHKAHDDGKKIVLLVDNCHRLTQEMLEELRLLSNIEKTETKLINIFFIGEPEFNDILVQPKNRAVRQRLTLKIELPSLNVSETEEYVRHRLSVAGVTEKIFAVKAVGAIQRISRGIPRNINTLCEHSLVAGAVRGKKTIDHRLVEECLAKLGLPAHPSKEDIAALSSEKRSLESFREKFIANGGVMANGVVGYNFEEENQRGWLKYGFGVLTLAAFGVYLWWPQTQQVKIVDIDTQPEAAAQAQIPTQVTASPAVAMLEKNNSAINEKKAAALKNAILEKAYNDEVPEISVNDIAAVSPSQVEESVGTAVATNNADNNNVSDIIVEQADNAPVQQDEDKVDVPEVVVVADAPVDAQMEKTDQRQQVDSVAAVAAGIKNTAESTPQNSSKVLPSIEGQKVILPLQANSVKLTREGRNNLKKFFELLEPYPQAKLLVKGYVSSKTNSPENIKLSEERAANVKKILVKEGLVENQMEIRGMGNQEPLASNSTSAGRAKNRRVEVVVIDDGA